MDRQVFKNKDHIGFTLSLYIAKWYLSLVFGFLFWGGRIGFGRFKKLAH